MKNTKTTEEIIECLQVLENFHSPNPQKINHYKGVDDMGPYEYFSYGEKTGTSFSSPNLHWFIDNVTRKWNVRNFVNNF